MGMTRGRSSVGKGHLESHLRRTMAEDPRMNVLDVDVKIIDGRVYLRGEVSSHALRLAAQMIAEEVAEGMPVENCLVVQQTEHARSEHIK
jgi:osmotically-inducible protein OsmY